MRNAHLHPLLELFLVPRLPLLRRYLRGQDLGPNPFVLQKVLQAPRHVALASVYREELHLSTESELVLDFLNQPPLLGVDDALVEVRRLGNHEALPFTVFVRGISVERAETAGTLY
jgi:hypothetical protein